MGHIRTVRFVLALTIVLGLAGCAAKAPEVRQRIFWPPPPDVPRIEWLGTYSSEDSFPKTEGQKRMETIIGKPPVTPFRSPSGIAANSKGLVHVADSVGKNVLIYDLDNYKLSTIADRSGGGSQVNWPLGMAFDADDNLYVADLERRAVMKFGPDLTLRTLIGTADDLVGPTYVAVDDRRNRLYVSDPRADKIHVYSKEGKKLSVIGPELAEGKRIANPQGIAVDAEGNLFVASQISAVINVISPAGELLRTLGERGDQVYQFEAPKCLAFDSDGNLWVGDARRPYIYTYTPQGRILLATGGETPDGKAPMGFKGVVGIYIDKHDRLYVADRYLKRFSVWQYFSTRYLAENPLPGAAGATGGGQRGGK